MSHYSSFSLLVWWNAQACRNVGEGQRHSLPKVYHCIPFSSSFSAPASLTLVEMRGRQIDIILWWTCSTCMFKNVSNASDRDDKGLWICCLQCKPIQTVYNTNVLSKANMLSLISWLVWWHLSMEPHISPWFSLSVKAHSEWKEALEHGCAVFWLYSSPAE